MAAIVRKDLYRQDVDWFDRWICYHGTTFPRSKSYCAVQYWKAFQVSPLFFRSYSTRLLYNAPFQVFPVPHWWHCTVQYSLPSVFCVLPLVRLRRICYHETTFSRLHLWNCTVQCSTAFQLCTRSVRWYSLTVQCTLPSVSPFLSLLFVFPFPDFSQSKLHEISAYTFVRLCYFRHECAKRPSAWDTSWLQWNSPAHVWYLAYFIGGCSRMLCLTKIWRQTTLRLNFDKSLHWADSASWSSRARWAMPESCRSSSIDSASLAKWYLISVIAILCGQFLIILRSNTHYELVFRHYANWVVTKLTNRQSAVHHVYQITSVPD